MLKKTMPVKANSFQVLLNPVGNNDSKKYIFYVKVDDVPLGIPMATNPIQCCEGNHGISPEQ